MPHTSEVWGVSPIEGELFRFHVRSRTRGIQHLVDLEEYEWNGACSCEHFTLRFRRQLEDGAAPGNSRRCDHIKRARDYALEELLPLVAKHRHTIVHHENPNYSPA